MKNTHIKTLTKPIDKNTRLSVYKESLERFLNQQEVDGLCLLLPMVLWGLEHYLDDYLDEETRQNWCWTNTRTAFPELTQEVLDKISSKSFPVKNEVLLQGSNDFAELLNSESVNAIDAKEELEFFFNILKNSEAKSIGGKIPDSNLYYK